MMQNIEGNIKNNTPTYAVINTTEYTQDNRWSIIVTEYDYDKLTLLGFVEKDLEVIKKLQIGEQATFDYGLDAQVVRLG